MAESLIADEEARRRQSAAAAVEEIEAKLRLLEDEREQVVAALSGEPSVQSRLVGDKTVLRGRLDELNREITSITEALSGEHTRDAESGRRDA